MKFKNGLYAAILSLAVFSGCSNVNKVEKLIEEENYSEAYEEIQNDPEKYAEFRDEVTYNLAKASADEGDYAQALEYLDNNSLDEAKVLKDEVTLKKNDEDFLADMAKALDARYAALDEQEKYFSKDSHIIPIKAELDIIESYYDKDFYDDELEELVKQYIDGCRAQLKAYDQWDENLFKTSLDALAANGDRLIAVQKINALHPLAVTEKTSKETLSGYNDVVAAGVTQQMYGSFEVVETGRYDNSVDYEVSGTNTSDSMWKTDPQYDTTSIFGGVLLDRNGDIAANLYDEGVKTLRPGQSFTISAWTDKSIGDLKDYYYE